MNRKIEVFEIINLRNKSGIRSYRINKFLIRERHGCELNVMERIQKDMLKQFYHVERKEEEILVKRVYWATIESNGGRRIQQKRWRNEENQ